MDFGGGISKLVLKMEGVKEGINSVSTSATACWIAYILVTVVLASFNGYMDHETVKPQL
jgi:hypothetical protein